MAAQHTPGPWTYWHDTCAACDAKGEREFVIDGPPGASHGQFSHEPDARLMAAAPDMVEALEPFATAARGINPDLPDDTVVSLRIGTHTVYHVALGSLRAARAAIAKATGETGQ